MDSMDLRTPADDVAARGLQVVIFGLEQVVGQIYRVFKLTRNMLPVDGRGHKVQLPSPAHCVTVTITPFALQRPR